jgi:Leucine-rich repeat (LRR) protein
MWAQLGQHIHPDDTETWRAVRQNNGSIASTAAAYARAHNPCEQAAEAFARLVGMGADALHAPWGDHDPAWGDAISFNGLKEELMALDIHQDHYERRGRPKRPSFGHLVAADFRALHQRMPALRRIDITCATLSNEFVEAMVVGLAGCAIEELILHHCALRADDLALILEHMAPTLTTLDVSYNDLSDHGVGALDFTRALKLQTLDLSHCGVDLADVNLTGCTGLQTLNLSSNAGGASFLMGHDLGAMPHLQVLQLNRTQLVGGSLGHLDLTGNAVLHTLDLGYNALRNDDMHKFAVAAGCAIEKLNVSGNALGAEGFVTLQKKGLQRLVELDFADNDLSDYGRLRALHTPTLHHWPHLQTLDLAGCDGMTKQTLQALQLHEAQALRHLDLSSTQLCDAIFTAIPWAAMPALQTFRAEFNHVSPRGIEAAAFHACRTLLELDVQNHAMGRAEALRAFAGKPDFPLRTLRLRNRTLEDASPDPDADGDIAPLVQLLRRKFGAAAHIEV